MFKKKKPRYAETKKQKNTREVMSYEDMPLDDYEQEKTELSPLAVKKIIVAVCAVVLIGLIVFCFANRESLTPENISNWWSYDVLGKGDQGFPVDIVGSEVTAGNFSVSQGHVVYASDTSFVTLNSSGSEVANIQLRYIKPIMKNAGNRFITYGLGVSEYQIDGFDSKLFEGEADGRIYCCDIASNGVYCIATDGGGYLSQVNAYDEKNNRIFKYSFSDYYITTVVMNPSGTGCLAIGISGNEGTVQTAVYELDFKNNKTIAPVIVNDYVLDADYMNDNRAVLVGSSAAYILKHGEENLTPVSYDNMSIANYDISQDTNTFVLALSRSGDGRSCNLVSYNDNGDKRYEITTEHSAESISLYKNSIGILDGNNGYIYNADGRLVHSGPTGAGSQRMILTSDSTAYLLSVNQVRSIDFNNISTADTASRQE